MIIWHHHHKHELLEHNTATLMGAQTFVDRVLTPYRRLQERGLGVGGEAGRARYKGLRKFRHEISLRFLKASEVKLKSIHGFERNR